jgi:Fic family protein
LNTTKNIIINICRTLIYSVRVEKVGQRDHVKYYLVKDVRVGPRTAKLKKYLGTKAPTSRELAACERKFALGLELKAADTVGRLGAEAYKAKYLTKDRIRALEEIRYMAKLSSDILSKSELKAYEELFEVKYVQGTTAIEGNTLTLGETADLLLHGIVPRYRSLREINEVQNFKSLKAFRDKYKGRVTLAFIKKLHSLIMHNIDEESAGSFRRTDDIGILGADLHLCPSMLIENELVRITADYYRRIKENYHPFEEIVMYHYAFEAIHPFADGNGRVGRELFNYMLTKKGYPRLLFPGDRRSGYIDALRHGNEGRYAEMVSAFADLAISQKADVLRENIRKILYRTP